MWTDIFLTGFVRFVYLLWHLLLRLQENSGPGMLRTEREAFSVCLSRSDHITSCQWTRLQYKVIPGNAFYWHNTHNYKMQMNNWSHHIGCSQQRWAGLRGTWRSKYSDTQRPLRTQTALREKNRERYHPETTNEWGDDWSFLARVQGGWAGGNRL